MLYDRIAATRYLGVSRQTLMRWVRLGALPARKVAGKWWFELADLDRIMPPDVREARRNA